MSDSNLPEWLDEDRDGKPDPKVAKFAWEVALFIVRMLAPSHTKIRKAVEHIDAHLPP